MDCDLVSEALKDFCSSSQSHKKIQLKEWSMVVIRDSPSPGDCSIFPPINHENLRIPSHPCQEQQNLLSPSSSSSSSLASFSVSSSSPSLSTLSGPPSPSPLDSRVKEAGEVKSWIEIGLEVLRCKVSAVVSSFRNYDAAKPRRFWSFGAAATAVVLWMLFIRARRRQQGAESRDRLMQVIKEKDEVGL